MTVFVQTHDDLEKISLLIEGDTYTHITHLREFEARRLAIDLEHALDDE